MTNIFQFSVLFLFLMSLVSCEEKGTENNPEKMAYFISQFPDKEINLSRRWGQELSLLSADNDTMHLAILYDNRSKINIILNRDNNDTIFKGKVFKYKRLYYFSRQWADSAYNLFAVRIHPTKIYGLDGESMQMHTLFSLMDSDTIHSVKSLRDTTVEKFHYELRPDKKTVSLFYKSIIDNFPPMLILSNRINNESSEVNDEKEETDITEDITESENSPILQVAYPNPVQDYLTLKMYHSSTYQVRVCNSGMQEVLEENFNGNEKVLFLGQLPKGFYFLKVKQPHSNKEESIKILIE